MTVNDNYTPLPPLGLTPMRVEVGDWIDLSSDSRQRILRQSLFRNQVLNLKHIGGRPEADVSLELSATAQTSRGEVTSSEEYETPALTSYDNPVNVGPIASKQFDWRVRNRSNTDYTQANNNPYQTFINYEVRPMTVLDKLRRGIGLSQQEHSLRQDFNLSKYTRMGVTPPKAPFYEPNLEGKTVIETKAAVETFDLSDTGEDGAETVFDYNVSSDEVLYITGLTVNSQDYTYDDNLLLEFTRDGTDNFYRIETYGIPGQGYEMDLHIPVLTDLNIAAFASNAINNVEVNVEYASVQRTLVEKAMYDLEAEVRTDDTLSSERSAAYEQFQELMQVGLPVARNIDKVLSETGADDKVLEAQ